MCVSVKIWDGTCSKHLCRKFVANELNWTCNDLESHPRMGIVVSFSVDWPQYVDYVERMTDQRRSTKGTRQGRLCLAYDRHPFFDPSELQNSGGEEKTVAPIFMKAANTAALSDAILT